MGGLEGGLAILVNESIPCVLFEDEHLLVVNKPAGWNTHAPSPHAGEGIYDWLRHREARWAKLAIIHRLDKETSGVLVFSKTPLANRALTEQFAQRTVRKRYLLLASHCPDKRRFTAVSAVVRLGDRYVSRPIHAGADRAETKFEVLEERGDGILIQAVPLTGRTHQIRVHAKEHGFSIIGDSLYGGAPAPRLMLHAEEIVLTHPASGEDVRFHAVHNFAEDPPLSYRGALINSELTNAYRLIHGVSDGWPGWYVDRLGDFLLSQAEQTLTEAQRDLLNEWMNDLSSTAVYCKTLSRHVRESRVAETSPKLFLGDDAPERFTILENGIQYELSFNEGYSVGLFLDQRDNRRRFLTGHIAAGFESARQAQEVLNAFAYTCGFSVCAARSNARVTSLDLSKKYLDWGKRNFSLNGINPAQHEFIYGDAFEWFKRLGKKGRQFDCIILDPPTFSQSRASGVFRAEKDFGALVTNALPLLKPEGILLASANAAKLSQEGFMAAIEAAVRRSKRAILQEHYFPQPPDFPVSRAEPAYLKTLWMKVG
jgi:23S rRNA (cytosine1962-C5)-methyltransferase